MATLETVLLILLIVDAIALVGLVLIQQSKGADVGAAFGSGSSGAMFGPTGGASFLVRLTTILAILFFVITFALAYTAKQRADLLGGFDLDESAVEVESGSDIPDIDVDSVDESSDVLEGDELPLLQSPSSEQEGDAIPTVQSVGEPNEDSSQEQQ